MRLHSNEIQVDQILSPERDISSNGEQKAAKEE